MTQQCPIRHFFVYLECEIIGKFQMFITRYFHRDLLRWFLVGSVTVGIDWIIFINLLPLFHSVALTNLVSISISVVFNYISHYMWTFKSTQQHLQSVFRYLATFVGGYFLNTFFVKLFIHSGFTPGTGKILAAIIQAPVNYLVSRYFVFKGVTQVEFRNASD